MHWEIISNTVIVIVLSYIIGSIPTSFIAAKILKGIDIREYGSKNIGATNVYRTLGLLPALFVLAIDIGKGLIAVVFISQLSIIGTDSVVNQELIKIIVGIFAIIGHNWTMFLSFKGGKGVATSAGVFLVLHLMLCL